MRNHKKKFQLVNLLKFLLASINCRNQFPSLYHRRIDFFLEIPGKFRNLYVHWENSPCWICTLGCEFLQKQILVCENYENITPSCAKSDQFAHYCVLSSILHTFPGLAHISVCTGTNNGLSFQYSLYHLGSLVWVFISSQASGGHIDMIAYTEFGIWRPDI